MFSDWNYGHSHVMSRVVGYVVDAVVSSESSVKSYYIHSSVSEGYRRCCGDYL
jgi:hypothetical protein